MYGIWTMILKEERRSNVRIVQMHNLIDLRGIKIVDKVPNLWIKKLCKVRRGVNEKIDENCSLVVQPCGGNGE